MKKSLLLCLIAVLACTELWSQDTLDSAQIFYPRGYRGVDINYRNNGTELSRLIKTLRMRLDSGHLSNVVIRSWTSPDGISRCNEILSERRADSLKAYIVRNAGIPSSIIRTQGEGIAWELLRNKVAASEMRYKEDVLNILDNTPVWISDEAGRIIDGRQKQLMDLHSGIPYKYLQEYFFPELCTSIAIINYHTTGDHTMDTNEESPSPESSAGISDNDKEVSYSQEAAEKNTDTGTDAKEPLANCRPAQENIPDETSKMAASQRMALKTNLLYDAILMPSLEIEYRFHDRWTVNLEGNMAWWNNDRKHKYYQLATISPEIRWWFGQKENSWHGHYLGMFGGYSLYDLENGKLGYQGEAAMAGLTYGYMFPIGRRLSLEVGIGIGYMYCKYDEYQPVSYMGGTHYVFQKAGNLNYFGPLKLKLALAWRLWDYDKKIGGGK